MSSLEGALNEKLDNQAQAKTQQVIKRNGEIAHFDHERIRNAIYKAFLATYKDEKAQSSHIHETVKQLADEVVSNLKRRVSFTTMLHIEDIQDQVELILMRAGEHKVAREYILYREAHKKIRQRQEKQKELTLEEKAQKIEVIDTNGHRASLNIKKLKETLKNATKNLADTKAQIILEQALPNLYNGISAKELNDALIMTSRTLIESEPNYSYVTARLLLGNLYEEASNFIFGEMKNLKNDSFDYKTYFPKYIQKGIELDILDEQLNSFDLEKLALALDNKNDQLFTYLGLQTLYDRYFIHSENIRYELPQSFFMRVAMGLSLNETNKTEKAIEFYRLLSSFDFMSSTPTLFNSGTKRSQLSSCYLTTISDDLDGIYGAMKDNALLSKFAGGLGNDWSNVRALGSHIKGTNGKSLGVVPFMNVADATAVAVNQGGKRKGAVCAYLETWHLDIEDFLELRKNTGDERRRTHDMNTANWIPDLFMKRVFKNGDWTLFSPDDASDLHDLYGKEFEKSYKNYERQAKSGEITHFKTVKAINLWRKMLGMLFETGHPWMTFKDPCNVRSPQSHIGVVHSSNLCTEITLNTSKDEIAVCNLGSINLANHIKNGKINQTKLEKTIKTAIRMLDNVIDINYYPVPEAKNSNLKHRPIGLGMMGLQDCLYQLNIPFASEMAVNFSDELTEIISYHAIFTSSELAKERGAYSSFKGSLWDQNILPIDSVSKLKEIRGHDYLTQDSESKLNWQTVRDHINQYGMRNSNVLAIAPTATISNICGVSQSIEPTYQNLYVKSNLSGEFTIINQYLVKALKSLDLWDDVMINDLKYYHGDLTQIKRIPNEIKNLYQTAFYIEPKWLIEAASKRQKWIDQSQSLNLYIANPSGKKIDETYKLAWVSGLKTTYYLRSLGATNAERSTVTDSALNAVSSANLESRVCNIDDPDCEACQ